MLALRYASNLSVAAIVPLGRGMIVAPAGGRECGSGRGGR
jgi:hypothetical protein